MAEGPINGDVNMRTNSSNRHGTFFASIPLVELIDFPPAMTQAQLQEIPKVKITKEQAVSVIKCAVCFDEFKLNENVRKLPCNHMYHSKCVFPWLETNPSCPVCRAPLVTNDVNDNTDGLDIILRQHFERLTAELFRHIAQSQEQLSSGHVHYFRITPSGLLAGEEPLVEVENSPSQTSRIHETEVATVNDALSVRGVPRRAAALRARSSIQQIYRKRRNVHDLH